jgi:tetratricopeptide (TPR) repeat protein
MYKNNIHLLSAIKAKGLLLLFLLAMSFNIALAQNDSLLLKLDLTKSPQEKVDLLNELCKQLWFSDLGKSSEYGNQALKLSKEIKYKEGEATSLNNLGVVSWVHGDYYRALDLYYTSINLRDSIGGKLGLGNTYHNIGNIFRSTKNWDKAVEWFEKTLKIRYTIDDQLGISYSKNNLGLIAQERGQYKKALKFLDEALMIRKEINNPRGVATSLLSIGKVYMELDNSQSASQYFNEALAIWKSINHIQGQAMTYLALAALDINNNDLSKGLENSADALILAKTINAKPELMEIHEFRANIYSVLQRYEEAFQEQSLTILYKDSIFDENKLNIIQQRNYDQIAYKNELLESENTLQNELLDKQSRIYEASVVIIILLAISLFLVYRVLRTRIKNNRELTNKNNYIAEQKKLIEDANAMLEQKVKERTNELRMSNERLIKYSWFNSHGIRAPLARLLGLTYLSKISSEEEVKEYISLIDVSAKELDQKIKEAGLGLTSHMPNEEDII